MISLMPDVPTCSYLFLPSGEVGTSKIGRTTPSVLTFLPDTHLNISPGNLYHTSNVGRNSRNVGTREGEGRLFCSTSTADVPTRKEQRAPGCIVCGGSGLDVTRPLPWGGYESCARCLIPPDRPPTVHPAWRRHMGAA